VLKNVLFVKNTVLDTDLADTIHIQYNTHALEGFKMKNFEFLQQNECLGLIYTVNQTNIQN